MGSIIFEFPLSLQASSHALASLGIFHPSLFTGLIIDRMFFDLFDNSFLLNFALESFECVLERLSFFNNDKSQEKSPPYKTMGEFTQFPGECQAPIW